jgi:NADH:ubiquinone oxidoreductase subunit F (NADH-binding)/NADH:ubiquinone oxidoreductase subunit E
MKAQRRYWETHRGVELPLARIQTTLQSGSDVSPESIAQLSRETGLPAAAVRGAISFYTDLHERKDAVRVCQGTSCRLSGAAKLKALFEGRGPSRDVYCLGYCDQSPAVLHTDGQVFTGDEARRLADGIESPGPAKAPAARSLARRPLVLARILAGDFSQIEKARAAGVYCALEKALTQTPAEVLSAVERSGQRGRGGAGFPTGAKWRTCAEVPGESRFVVVNGDEGDPGAFIDRVLMEKDPHTVIEGILLCGYAVGAARGIVFIRSEYPRAIVKMRAAVEEARAAGILGDSILNGRCAMDISVVEGLGSYVCGEESAMLNSIEGLRGEVRVRPPYPAVEGLYGKPTVVNNVETLANIPPIIADGADAYAAMGTDKSNGTKVICLNRGFARPGLLEVEFGISLREVIEEAGGGADDKRLDAVVLGGPMGSLLVPEEWDVPVCYGAMGERGIQLGHGGLVAIPKGSDARGLLEHWLEFMMEESCGKCVPCRLGSRAAWNLLKSNGNGTPRPQLERLFEVMEQASLCAFGQNMPGPMRALIRHFGGRIFIPAGRP